MRPLGVCNVYKGGGVCVVAGPRQEAWKQQQQQQHEAAACAPEGHRVSTLP